MYKAVTQFHTSGQKTDFDGERTPIGAMLAVKEERTVIGGVELERKTVLAADEQG